LGAKKVFLYYDTGYSISIGCTALVEAFFSPPVRYITEGSGLLQ
jgi:hypothetical protein